MKLVTVFIMVVFINVLLADTPVKYNLEQVKGMALERNLSLKTQNYKIEQAKVDDDLAFYSFLPQATGSASYSAFRPSIPVGFGDSQENQTSLGISVNQPIFNNGKIWIGKSLTKDGITMQELTLDDSKLSLSYNVEDMYYSVLEAKMMLEVLQKSVESSKSHEVTAKTRFELGTLSKADYLRFQSQTANYISEYSLQKSRYMTLKTVLKNYIQLDGVSSDDFVLEEIKFEKHEADIEIISAINFVTRQSYIERIRTFAEQNNPAYRQTDLSKEMAEKSLLTEELGYLPNLNLSYKLDYSKTNLDDDYDDQQTLTLAASVPLFPIIDTKRKVDKANVDVKIAELSKRSFHDEMNYQIENSFVQLISSAVSVKASKVSLELSRETYEQMKVRFENHMISANEMLDTEISLKSAENSFLMNYFGYLRAKAGLMRLLATQDINVFNNIVLK